VQDHPDTSTHARRRLDLQAIHELKARYFRCMDTRDWAGMYEVFTSDAVMDMRDDIATLAKSGMPVDPDGGLITGRDVIVPGMQGPLEGTVTVHHGHMPEITFVSEDESRGIWAMEDNVHLPAGAPFRRLHGFGYYHETYRREEDGCWRIATLKLTRLFVELA